MANKRKRKGSQAIEEQLLSQRRREEHASVRHALLPSYYPKIHTLREYLLVKLPSKPRSRRKQLRKIPLQRPEDAAQLPLGRASAGEESALEISERLLLTLLDTTLVGHSESTGPLSERWKQQRKTLERYLQHEATNGPRFSATLSQSALVEFAIRLLFASSDRFKPAHLLCHGYRKTSLLAGNSKENTALPELGGTISMFPNPHVNRIKTPVWETLLRLLGKNGEYMMLDLILNCGMFVPLDAGNDNFHQVSGVPLPDLPLLQAIERAGHGNSLPSGQLDLATPASKKPAVSRKAAEITFVKSRMLYARPSLNARGEIRFGLRHIHAFNRYANSESSEDIIHLMKYIFPRQFSLHNAFTSIVDSRETTHKFKDYTLREQEIEASQLSSKARSLHDGERTTTHLPRRLRGNPLRLVAKMQKLHSRCAYVELLRHYCPAERFDGPKDKRLDRKIANRSTARGLIGAKTSLQSINQEVKSDDSLVDAATPIAQVSAFCRAALHNIVPNEIWGEASSSSSNSNKCVVLKYVDEFIQSKRFETLRLHEAVQGIKLGSLIWLVPPKQKRNQSSSKSDMAKRREILLEFLYYLFDSLLVPLIRSNFYVTESSKHGNRLFFFRHDVWRALTEPSLATIKLSMYRDLPTDVAKKALDSRALGFGQLRLLPKGSGVRPIMNLKRRMTKLSAGRVMLGRSINSIMKPVFNIFKYERDTRPAQLGSALFSVGDLYPRLREFRAKQPRPRCKSERFFFAKVDVKSCFDTIPQDRVLAVMQAICSEDEYKMASHVEIRAPLTHGHRQGTTTVSKPRRKFVTSAQPGDDFDTLEGRLNEQAGNSKQNTVYVDSVVKSSLTQDKSLDLLREHVQRNIVKIGKKFLQQKEGIPQGSVLSTLLCSFFYADFERKRLDFLDPKASLLVRLIDDFLLITTDRAQASQFLQVMHDGDVNYGISVSPEKTLVNFDVSINGMALMRESSDKVFPYCGIAIDTVTLDVGRDWERRKGTVLADSLTVEKSKTPGHLFYQKAMSSFILQTHAMYTDSTFNSPTTVLGTLHQNFIETAMKYYRYAKLLPGKQLQASLMTQTISDLIRLAHTLVTHKPNISGYRCDITQRQIQWLASTAFRHVLAGKQTRYRHVLAWLDDSIRSARPTRTREVAILAGVARRGEKTFAGYRF